MWQSDSRGHDRRNSSSTAVSETGPTPSPIADTSHNQTSSTHTTTGEHFGVPDTKDFLDVLDKPSIQREAFDIEDDADKGTRFRSPSLHNLMLPFQRPYTRSDNDRTHGRIGKPPMGVLSIQRASSSSAQRGNVVDLEKSKANAPQPVGFWHTSLRETRLEVLRRYSETLFVLCVAIMGILSIYWGVLFDVKKNLHKATVAVVDFDGLAPYESYTPIVGPFIRSAVEGEMLKRPDHLGFKFIDPAEFDYDPMKVRLEVFEEHHWAAIIINSNATALLTSAVLNGNSSYNPRGAASIVYNQARDIESYNFYIIPALSRVALNATTTFGSIWAPRVINNDTFSAATYSNAPQALSPGISFQMINLRPFDPPTAIPTITIGLIYLIIIAFFSFTFFIPTHMKFVLPNPQSPHPPLKFYQLIAYRWCATITAYFFLSFAYSLVSLAFQIPFSHMPPPVPSPLNNGNGHWTPYEPVHNASYLGHATWVVYWLVNWIGMAALGITCENMAMLLSALSPLPYSALFLIWWVITNVSTGFYALEIASPFYRWGYAWPLRHIVQASKTLVFGTKSQLGLNFGVLFVWVLIGTLLFPIACWVQRWKNIKDRKRAAASAAVVAGASPIKT